MIREDFPVKRDVKEEKVLQEAEIAHERGHRQAGKIRAIWYWSRLDGVLRAKAAEK